MTQQNRKNEQNNEIIEDFVIKLNKISQLPTPNNSQPNSFDRWP